MRKVSENDVLIDAHNPAIAGFATSRAADTSLVGRREPTRSHHRTDVTMITTYVGDVAPLGLSVMGWLTVMLREGNGVRSTPGEMLR